MNIDIENQENFEKKKKIIIISLSAALLLITLIAGLFWVKKNKESSYKNDDLSEVVDEENSENKKKENEEIIVNGSDYFFEKKAGLVTINILSFLIIGILFFFWENDKLPSVTNCNCSLKGFSFAITGGISEIAPHPLRIIGAGLFEKSNWFGFATLGALIIITVIVELVLNFLIGSISHFLSKDKNKRYFHTLKMSFRKRIHYFSSFSITKTLFIALSYLLCGIIIAIFARVARKYHPCCDDEIIKNHGRKYCLCCCEVRKNDNFKDYSYLLKQKRKKERSKRIYDKKIEKAKKENEKKDGFEKRVDDGILSKLTEDDIKRIEEYSKGVEQDAKEMDEAEKKENKMPKKKLEVKKDEENKESDNLDPAVFLYFLNSTRNEDYRLKFEKEFKVN